ncbi:MAG: helix-turn-helix domain-containing protein, partial [Salinivirgaceae bacterium]|nr:helix-turn-helix domain-containing protein [Salinivirgaceae bacterium]
INFDLESKNWEITNVIPIGTENGISNCHFPTCFLRHPNGDFYIGTKGGGLNRRVAGETKFTFFLHDAVNKRSISDNSIECMVADRKGNIWIGTQAGLNLFDIQTSTFSRLWASDGLTDDYILAIAIDSKNRAWVSTRRGISSVSDDLKTIKNYDITDGLPSNEFLPRSVATDDAGNIYFGSTRGLVWFHPDSIGNNHFMPEAVIVDFKIIGKGVMKTDNSPLKQSIELVTDINLNHRQSSFSFQMAAIDYFNPLRNQISYKLDGYDKNWIKARTDQIAIYKNVPSGTYTFSVRASNEDGICNPKERQIKLTISPPFWFSWHAILFYVLLFASGSWYVTHRKKKPEGATSGNSSLSLLKNSNYDFIQPSIIITEPSDQRFIQKVLSQIEENIADKEFGVQQLAKKMNLTRSQLYRRINNITHISVVEFIKVVRLKRAAQLLSQQPENISEVAFQVGFNDLSYFSKCFKYQFGVSPARFLAEQEHVLQSNN